MASRLQVATYIADRLEHDRKAVLQSAAAWLSEKGRTRQAPYLARDIAQVLATRGYVLAKVTTARPLSHEATKEIAGYVAEVTGGKAVELETATDPDMIGGIKLETPGHALDASVQTKLERYVANAAQLTMEATN
jgi:F-type H+-transporting ATPase subunit delta